MFDKLTVKAGIEEEAHKCTVYVNWSWIIGNDDTTAPSCKLFCCGVEQEKLINNFLFRQEEILDWFDKEVVNFRSPNFDNNFKLFYQNPSNMGNCYFNTVSFHSGESLNRQQPLRFPYESKNKIFFICVYDDTRCDYEVVAVNNAAELKYELAAPKKLFGFFGDDTPMLKNIEGDNRQKVLIVDSGGKTTYSMIPKGQSELYISKELAACGTSNIKIKYLTDFI